MEKRSNRGRLPTRFRILDALRGRPSGFWTLDEIAGAQGIDRSVAFEHLEMLVKANLATKHRIGAGRGRPTNVYRYVPAAGDQVAPPQRSRLLASLLAQTLAISPDGAQRAREIGRQFGATIGQVERLGDTYAIDGRSVHALTCVFEQTCTAAQHVVCDLHAGLIEGTMGVEVRVNPEGPDGLGGCRFSIEKRS